MLQLTVDSGLSLSDIPINPANWVFGDSLGSENEYIIHTAQPRFAAKIWERDVDGFTPQSNGIVFDIGNYMFYDIQWLDNEPDVGLQTTLMLEAAAGLDRYSENVEDDVYDDYNH